MKIVFITLLYLCTTNGLTALGQARGWRGLIPLTSTRADVERLLGQPTETFSKNSVFYRTLNETMIIAYANGLRCGIGEKYSQWRVPRDTVISILVTPTGQLPFSDLVLDQSKYRKSSGGHRPEDVYYINDQDGISITVFRNDVVSISLYPGRIDAHKSCFPLEITGECKGLTPPPTNSYGSVTLRQEKMHLDNLGIALSNNPDATGYIIAYAGMVARAGEANALLERARNHLRTVRHLPVERLRFINGGFQETKKVNLYVVPRNACPPIPSPTIDPRDVQINRSRG